MKLTVSDQFFTSSTNPILFLLQYWYCMYYCIVQRCFWRQVFMFIHCEIQYEMCLSDTFLSTWRGLALCRSCWKHSKLTLMWWRAACTHAELKMYVSTCILQAGNEHRSPLLWSESKPLKLSCSLPATLTLWPASLTLQTSVQLLKLTRKEKNDWTQDGCLHFPTSLKGSWHYLCTSDYLLP